MTDVHEAHNEHMGRFVVVKALGLVTIQHGASYSRIHEGFAPGGPLVPSLLDRANRRLGNEHGAGIEVCGQVVLRALVDMLVATDRDARSIAAGEELAITSGSARVTYVTITNGVHVPRGFGSYAFLGEILRAGDRIDQGVGLMRRPAFVEIDKVDGEAKTSVDIERNDHEEASELDRRIVRVIPGPDADAFAPDALDQLAKTEWRISATSNRTGTRLEGPAITRRTEYVEQSRPMVIGAIEVPRDGAPIVLGPEHPTTGGYPLLAVVASDSLDVFHAIPLGGRVRFRC